MKRLTPYNPLFVVLMLIALVLTNCARMQSPDGGWYDEVPPKVVGAEPSDRGTNVKKKKVTIMFDEYVKIENPTEKVVISPPQSEMPEIKAAGKNIVVELKDTLKENTTYTIDFSDAISDNNEGNPMGNYTYCFSTGAEIDTMEVAGHVVNAEDLEPVKGILVGMYEYTDDDSVFINTPLLRVSRTNSEGYFCIKGVKPGSYRVFALQDMDGDYKYSQKSEMLAFNHDIIVPSVKDDTRLDTIWKPDHLHFDIARTGYRHFLPDDIVLRAFTEVQNMRYLKEKERKEPNCFSLYFSYGDSVVPQINGLNFDSTDAFIIESNLKKDTVTYWLRDTALVNQDTLRFEAIYNMTDSAGQLVSFTDTLELLAKPNYEKRLKDKQKAYDEWKKKQDKRKKKGQEYDSIMPKDPMKFEVRLQAKMDPDKNPVFAFNAPLAELDTSKIHLYAKHDTLWYNARYELRPLPEVNMRTYQVYGEWRPGIEYSLEVDSAAFVDIYGNVSNKDKKGFKIKEEDDYGTFTVFIPSFMETNIVVQLLDQSGKSVKTVSTRKGQADFFFLDPKEYYMMMFVDDNNNGIWDTGDYSLGLQPEEVYFYPKAIEIRPKWDLRETWNPKSVNVVNQKPQKLVKQKAETKKKVQNKNFQRAEKLGIKLPDVIKL